MKNFLKNSYPKLLFIIIIFILFSNVISVNSEKNKADFSNKIISAVEKENSQSYDGYTLFAPEYDTRTFLMDNNGRIVNQWESQYWQTLGISLMENGNLLRSCNRLPNPLFPFGGFTGRVEMFDWNDTLIWSFEYNDENVLLHHDLEILPNGNILMVAWEIIDYDRAINAGVNMDSTNLNYIAPDHIIEVRPTGSSGGEIVWEWHMWDHIIQDFDSSKENFGVVSKHPELIDINYNTYADKVHINSIDYNEQFDQILMSVRHYDEIWVIDHSTTTEEAAGHTGGRYCKGGDLLYRWGNPQTYARGSQSDKQLFFQHDASWIPETYPNEGNILIFNNGNNRVEYPYSSVEEIHPPINENGSYSLSPSSPFGPTTPTWQYTTEPKSDFFANHLSSVQRLPNGNTLICDGEEGYFFEVSIDKEKVWDYDNTITESDINPLRDDVFKIRRYPLDFEGIGPLRYQSPERPVVPVGEVSLRTGTDYVFESSAVDPNGDDLWYFFDWGDGSDSGWVGSFSSGELVSVSHSWSDVGEYEVRVKCRDGGRLESEWSDSLVVSVDHFTVWLFGVVDGRTVREDEISFWADSLVMISFDPFRYESFPLGVHMVVDAEYHGVLTEQFIAGRFYKKE